MFAIATCPAPNTSCASTCLSNDRCAPAPVVGPAPDLRQGQAGCSKGARPGGVTRLTPKDSRGRDHATPRHIPPSHLHTVTVLALAGFPPAEVHMALAGVATPSFCTPDHRCICAQEVHTGLPSAPFLVCPPVLMRWITQTSFLDVSDDDGSICAVHLLRNAGGVACVFVERRLCTMPALLTNSAISDPLARIKCSMTGA